MNKIKNTYSAPEADLLVVRFEQNFLTDSTNAVSIRDWQDGDVELDF